MPADNVNPDTDVEEVSGRLQDGIVTCRTVIENYRSLLRNEAQSSNESGEEFRADRPD